MREVFNYALGVIWVLNIFRGQNQSIEGQVSLKQKKYCIINLKIWRDKKRNFSPICIEGCPKDVIKKPDSRWTYTEDLHKKYKIQIAELILQKDLK